MVVFFFMRLRNLLVPITQNYGIANTIKWNHEGSLSFDIVALTPRRITFRSGSQERQQTEGCQWYPLTDKIRKTQENRRDNKSMFSFQDIQNYVRIPFWFRHRNAPLDDHSSVNITRAMVTRGFKPSVLAICQSDSYDIKTRFSRADSPGLLFVL